MKYYKNRQFWGKKLSFFVWHAYFFREFSNKWMQILTTICSNKWISHEQTNATFSCLSYKIWSLQTKTRFYANAQHITAHTLTHSSVQILIKAFVNCLLVVQINLKWWFSLFFCFVLFLHFVILILDSHCKLNWEHLWLFIDEE